MYNPYLNDLNNHSTDYLENTAFDNMPFSPSTELCCSPSSDPFISQQESEPIVVSPKDIHTHWLTYENTIPPFSMHSQHRHSLNFKSFRTIHKPRSKSVDTTSQRYITDNADVVSDDEESTLSQQSQFNLEFSDEEVDDMSLDDESIELDYSPYRNEINYTDEIWESPYELEDINVILNVSKTPCLDALAFCVTMRLGAYQTDINRQNGEIVVTNANKFLNGIHLFCPKKSQTQNDEARIKAIKRWFDGIPAKKKRSLPFVMRAKPNKTRDVDKIVHKMKKFVAENNLLQPITNQF